jgi:hypothetical protein
METATQTNYMTAAQITASGITSIAMLATRAAGQHSGFLLSLRRLFPITAAQAKLWHGFDCLGAADVERIEALLNKHGMRGEYSLTKSGGFCRLRDNASFKRALKAEYALR